jgi:iron complex transport system substrate-binding protein
MINRTGFYAFLLFAISCMSAGCGGDVTQKTDGEREGIITFAPSITETVFALGEGGRVVGVTNFCNYPPEAAELPRVGDVLNPNLEKLTALQPALVILPGPSSTAKVAQWADRLGITTVNGYMDDLETIRSGTLDIGNALGARPAAEKLIADMDAELDAIRTRVAGLDRPKVLLVPTRDSHRLDTIFSVGRESFLSELLVIAGGENILADSTEPYVEASKETLVVRAPDVIIEIHSGAAITEDEAQAYRDDWKALPTLPAVKANRVYILTEDYLLIPGPRVPLIARRFAECIHPHLEVSQR